ncbi:GNAT family N-acetyltransferase, partial [Dysosmobacter welbionis]
HRRRTGADPPESGADGAHRKGGRRLAPGGPGVPHGHHQGLPQRIYAAAVPDHQRRGERDPAGLRKSGAHAEHRHRGQLHDSGLSDAAGRGWRPPRHEHSHPAPAEHPEGVRSQDLKSPPAEAGGLFAVGGRRIFCPMACRCHGRFRHFSSREELTITSTDPALWTRAPTTGFR